MLHTFAGCLSLVIALSCSAVTTPVEDGNEEPPTKAKTIVVTGELTDEGVECQALRADDGKLYTLAGDIAGYKTGDRVRVSGEVAEVSTCMQGTTIGVKKIDKLESP